MPSIAQGFGQTTPYMLWWVLGQRTEVTTTDECRDGLNSYPQQVEITTATISNPGDNSTVGLTINGSAVSVNTGTGSITATAVAALLVTAINADPIAYAQVTASSSGATLTLTGRYPGLPITATDATAGVASITETQAAAVAAVVEFGRAVCHIGYQNTDRLVAKAQATLFSAQVISGLFTFVSGAVIQARIIEVRGSERIVLAAPQVTSATDAATTGAALVAAINSALPAATVLASGTSPIVLTAEVPGTEIALEFAHISGGASSPVFTVTNTTGPSISTSFHRAFVGVAERDQAVGAVTVGGLEAQYPGNSCMTWCKHGTVAVESAQAPAMGDDVYVELAAGSDAGKFFTTSSATRVRLSRALAAWELDADANTGNLAALRISIP